MRAVAGGRGAVHRDARFVVRGAVGVVARWAVTPQISLLRVATLLLAWVHTFPALRHLEGFFAEPSLGEAWKGFGGALAVVLYLQSPALQARIVVRVWRMRVATLPVGAAGIVLAAAHAVPAFDHLPKLIAVPSWADGWRGIGSAMACAWFTLPIPTQARVLSRLRSAKPPRARVACSGRVRAMPLANAAEPVAVPPLARLNAFSSSEGRDPREPLRRTPLAGAACARAVGAERRREPR